MSQKPTGTISPSFFQLFVGLSPVMGYNVSVTNRCHFSPFLSIVCWFISSNNVSETDRYHFSPFLSIVCWFISSNGIQCLSNRQVPFLPLSFNCLLVYLQQRDTTSQKQTGNICAAFFQLFVGLSPAKGHNVSETGTICAAFFQLFVGLSLAMGHNVSVTNRYLCSSSFQLFVGPSPAIGYNVSVTAEITLDLELSEAAWLTGDPSVLGEVGPSVDEVVSLT